MNRPAPIRPRVFALLLCALLITACGGGDAATDPPAQERAAAQAEAAADVRLEGCVVDVQARPASGRAIHARGVDGRLVATVYSDPDGVFVVRVPAHASIVLDTLLDGGDGAVVLTGGTSFSVGACFRVDRA